MSAPTSSLAFHIFSTKPNYYHVIRLFKVGETGASRHTFYIFGGGGKTTKSSEKIILIVPTCPIYGLCWHTLWGKLTQLILSADYKHITVDINTEYSQYFISRMFIQ